MKMNEIKMIVCDIDGVLTDGRVYMDESGKETKNYSLTDIDSLNMMKTEGYILCAITGEGTPLCNFFKSRLAWDDFITECKKKGDCLSNLAEKYSVDFNDVCYIGDGVYDIPALEKAGLAVCPANAIEAVKNVCDIILDAYGGGGALSELYNILSKSKIEHKLSANVLNQLDILIDRYPSLESVRKEILNSYFLMEKCYMNGGKIIIAGNGGSASDSEHIVGELMKSFRLKRPIGENLRKRLKCIDENVGDELSQKLEMPLRAVSLMGHGSLSSAFLNDVDGKLVVAQQLLGFANKSDIFWGISTSGNSENIVYAAVLAKALDMRVIAMTGKGRLSELSDVSIVVPEEETYMIQELHLPIYHCICLMLEERFYGKGRQL